MENSILEQFRIDPTKVLCQWIEDHGTMKFYWVLHVRDGEVVASHSNYCSPLEWRNDPCENHRA